MKIYIIFYLAAVIPLINSFINFLISLIIIIFTSDLINDCLIILNLFEIYFAPLNL